MRTVDIELHEYIVHAQIITFLRLHYIHYVHCNNFDNFSSLLLFYCIYEKKSCNVFV